MLLVKKQKVFVIRVFARYDQTQIGKIEHFDPSSSKSPSFKLFYLLTTCSYNYEN
jgi:hypothetical protein